MKYLIALVVIIATLAYLLDRRGSSGLGGGTETTEKDLGQTHRNAGPGAEGFGGG